MCLQWIPCGQKDFKILIKYCETLVVFTVARWESLGLTSLATILLNLPTRQRERVDKPAPAPKVKLDSLLAHTSHTLVHLHNRIRCSRCYSSFSLSDPACKSWLQLQCSPVAPSSSSTQHVSTPIQLIEQIHLGNQISHNSHKLASYRGLIYCSQCGARAGRNQIRHLAAQCLPTSSTGEYLLKHIRDKKLPPGFTTCPDSSDQ